MAVLSDSEGDDEMYKEEKEEEKASSEPLSRCLKCNTPQILRYDEISNFPYMFCPKCFSIERF